ncbi:MAG TPA: DUF3168 domain-containing protein [Vicinamibacterales bacterium]|nr:DUF3168 domain-containing protein [Vicinamibacterales bacterium]
MSVLALSPVSASVYGVLNVAALTALVTGVFDDVPQGTAFPYVWYVVDEENARGMGRGGMRQVNLRVHAVSSYEGQKELHTIMSKVIQLLEDTALTITGYQAAGEVVYRETVAPFQSMIDEVQVRESVAQFTIWAEPS